MGMNRASRLDPSEHKASMDQSHHVKNRGWMDIKNGVEPLRSKSSRRTNGQIYCGSNAPAEAVGYDFPTWCNGCGY
ncbi:unnamed protein product [Cylicostephanus goldi]|uniref:Uncharacterized protein n=1 Tax=Cylicostephanus goldi TaxID=71465 RepID=A0A3P6S4F6_CYLGO|nr:unnamed protein product [Cylicostephanus goldi]